MISYIQRDLNCMVFFLLTVCLLALFSDKLSLYVKTLIKVLLVSMLL